MVLVRRVRKLFNCKSIMVISFFKKKRSLLVLGDGDSQVYPIVPENFRVCVFFSCELWRGRVGFGKFRSEIENAKSP